MLGVSARGTGMVRAMASSWVSLAARLWRVADDVPGKEAEGRRRGG